MARMYTEVYCNAQYVEEVSKTLMDTFLNLNQLHPEWGIDGSFALGDWTQCGEEEESEE